MKFAPPIAPLDDPGGPVLMGREWVRLCRLGLLSVGRRKVKREDRVCCLIFAGSRLASWGRGKVWKANGVWGCSNVSPRFWVRQCGPHCSAWQTPRSPHERCPRKAQDCNTAHPFVALKPTTEPCNVKVPSLLSAGASHGMSACQLPPARASTVGHGSAMASRLQTGLEKGR